LVSRTPALDEPPRSTRFTPACRHAPRPRPRAVPGARSGWRAPRGRRGWLVCVRVHVTLHRLDFHRRASMVRTPDLEGRASGSRQDVAVRHHEPKEMSPMTVRWKPLLVLSGLFLIIAVIGVVAIVFTLVPRGSADILPQARAERAAR